MQVIVGGKFESALIHRLDEINRPEQNRTTHPYYLGLNRNPGTLYFERLSTFLAIAENIVVPTADWSDKANNDGVSGNEIGLLAQASCFCEWDDTAHGYAEKLLKCKALSKLSYQYIANLDLSLLTSVDRQHVELNIGKISRKVALHYLCRLFLQIREAGLSSALLVLDEADIRIISEICEFSQDAGELPPFAFPNLSEKVVLGCEFAGGLLNFSPRDMRSVAAIRKDVEVQRYATMVRGIFGQQSNLDVERRMLHAMRKSYKAVSESQKLEKVSEVIGWVAKPLHYIPGVDAAISVIEDIKDVGDVILKKEKEVKQWYLLAARANQVNIEEYLARKENL